jgi:Na+/H+ antiporter NhaD/arsenite permease-like protein
MGYTPQLWMALPFVVLLALIALGPLLFEHWWLKHYPKICFTLGALTVAYYLFGLPPAATHKVVHTGVEYISFIALIGSLFVVSGGIHINVKGEATPFANFMFLLIGAVVSNVLGTTGASMLLIRPWLRMNKYRVTAHHVVFFILIVSNVGGCLTPIGDPPLFLGYLRGVPFWWVAEHCWPMWLVGVGFLLAVFWVVDFRNYRRAPPEVRQQMAQPPDQWRFEGAPNIFFLLVILVAVLIDRPVFLREMLMVAAALGSWLTTRKEVHDANHFDFRPLREVAVLFIGIFATMIPALDWLQANASRMQAPSPALFYWSSGTLSSILDNAPTYLSFLTAALAMFVSPDTIAQVQHLVQNGGIDLGSAAEPVQNTYAALKQYFGQRLAAKTLTPRDIEMACLLGNARLNHYIVAISVGAVFFGANTYIGNGPNFMVKSIADHQKVHTPTFPGYVWGYTLPIMLPMLILVWLLFFRRFGS